jgi:archaellum component FlaC
MTRRRFRKQALAPSLFPFLAVLVCTMGALIVLLVLVVQQARVYADSVAEQKVARTQDELERIEQQKIEREDYEWRREVLEQQRKELTAKLADRRLELSHFEDHIRRLEDRSKRLQAEMRKFNELNQAQSQNSQQLEAELAGLQDAIDAAKQRLALAKEEAKNRPQAFAIIPYEGANGTKRRPIYIECTEEGIVIQPEGLVLSRRDFDGPLGPGNPLDAALRTIREYWARYGSTQQFGEPYPLLIVRPNGTIAYNFAREALKAWDDEFGYELIDADMQLAFPDRDPQLADLLAKTIEDARQRQEVLAAAMPSQFGRPGSVGLVASPNGGGFRMVGMGQNGVGQVDSEYAGNGAGNHAATDDAARGNAFRADSFDETEGGFADGAAANNANSNGANSDTGTSQAGGADGMAATDSEGQQASAGSTQPGAFRGATSGAPGGNGGMSMSGAQRGANWGVPKASGDATAYRIPVRVICQKDRFVILPRPSENIPPKEVMAADPLSESVDVFVKALWEQIDGWNEPPLGGYWLPVLEVYVPPGAEDRFIDLAMVLKGSGIQVQRQAK